MKQENNYIPSSILEDWEREAIDQEIPYTEFGDFLRMKERLYRQGMSTRKETPKIFANDARNKFERKDEGKQNIKRNSGKFWLELERVQDFRLPDFVTIVWQPINQSTIIMAKKVLIYIAGSLLLAPCFIALCCDSLLFATFAIIYGVVLYHSPKFSTRIRRFWFEFWRMNIQAQKMLKVR